MFQNEPPSSTREKVRKTLTDRLNHRPKNITPERMVTIPKQQNKPQRNTRRTPTINHRKKEAPAADHLPTKPLPQLQETYPTLLPKNVTLSNGTIQRNIIQQLIFWQAHALQLRQGLAFWKTLALRLKQPVVLPPISELWPDYPQRLQPTAREKYRYFPYQPPSVEIMNTQSFHFYPLQTQVQTSKKSSQNESSKEESTKTSFQH
jgi:hypothetical protein